MSAPLNFSMCCKEAYCWDNNYDRGFRVNDRMVVVPGGAHRTRVGELLQCMLLVDQNIWVDMDYDYFWESAGRIFPEVSEMEILARSAK